MKKSIKNWVVDFETKKAEIDFVGLIKIGKIKPDDIRIIRRWVELIEEHGPTILQNKSYWNDHALDGNLSGYRSSSFGYKGRIIYKIKEQKLWVLVVKITHSHNYELE